TTARQEQAAATTTRSETTTGPEQAATTTRSETTTGVLVIDNCRADLHARLAQICQAPQSTLSVITIEYDIHDDLPEETRAFRLDTSSPELIENLIRRRFKHISQVDANTITKFSDGNAKVALALAGTLRDNETVGDLRDDGLL